MRFAFWKLTTTSFSPYLQRFFSIGDHLCCRDLYSFLPSPRPQAPAAPGFPVTSLIRQAFFFRSCQLQLSSSREGRWPGVGWWLAWRTHQNMHIHTLNIYIYIIYIYIYTLYIYIYIIYIYTLYIYIHYIYICNYVYIHTGDHEMITIHELGIPFLSKQFFFRTPAAFEYYSCVSRNGWVSCCGYRRNECEKKENHRANEKNGLSWSKFGPLKKGGSC